MRYLERRLIELATMAKRASLANETRPDGGQLPEGDIAEMEEFLLQVRLLLGTLGILVFEPIPAIAPAPSQGGAEATPKDAGLRWSYTGTGFRATCSVAEDEFVVTRDSVARKEAAPSLSQSARSQRASLQASGVLVEEPDGLRFTQDFAFPSPTSAAQVVSGTTVNGRVVWRLEDGTTYKQWQEKQIAAAGDAASTAESVSA